VEQTVLCVSVASLNFTRCSVVKIKVSQFYYFNSNIGGLHILSIKYDTI